MQNTQPSFSKASATILVLTIRAQSLLVVKKELGALMTALSQPQKASL
jgi:hypothetical protein